MYFAETKVNLTTNKLAFHKNGIHSQSSYQRAADGQLGQKWADCAVSESSTPIVWLSIDLGHLYSVNKIRLLLSSLRYGNGTEVYVGKSAIKSDGTNDYQCGTSVNVASSTFTDFPCSPVNWVQHVSIRQTGQDGKGGNQWLLVCEVEVYYNGTEGRNR